MLRKLLPMLSSDKPGEVVAAVAAIDRTLRGAGCDFHDRASAVAKPTTPPHKEPPPRPYHREPPSPPDRSHWQAMREFCLSRPDLLRPREREFVEDLGHWRGNITDKQLGWLGAIHARLRRHS